MARLSVGALKAAVEDKHGGDVVAFCKSVGISKGTYYQWLRDERMRDSYMVMLEHHFRVPAGSLTPFSRDIDIVRLCDIIERVQDLALDHDGEVPQRAVMRLAALIYKNEHEQKYDDNQIKDHIKVASK